MKNWLFNSSSGTRIAEVRARARLKRECAVSKLRKRPALVSCRTKPCVTRMPFTDSAKVAVTRLKLSVAARDSRLSRSRKWRFTPQSTGAIATTTRKSTQSHHAMTAAATIICPPCTMLTKKTSWIPTRSDSTSVVTRPMIRPSFMRWKKLIG